MLAEGTVEMVVGFGRPTAPMSCRPIIVRSPDEADLLWWDEFCTMNVARFVPLGTGRAMAVVAKGCDSRNLVVFHQEGKIDLPGEVTVLGVPCRGMIDAELVRRAVDDPDAIAEVIVDGQTVSVDGTDLRRDDVIREACAGCRHPNPVIADELMAAKVPVEGGGPRHGGIEHLQSLSPAARRTYLSDIFADCISCYACRDACPLCYCEKCFSEASKVLWMGEPTADSDVMSFHFFRALHLAGRCTDCGACESACPVHIPVRLLAVQAGADLENAADFEAGLSIDAVAPVQLFQPGLHDK